MKQTLQQQFEAAVLPRKTTVFTVCYMFSKDSDEVADLFQECMVNLWKGFPKFRGESDLSTWIYRVSLNTCISLNAKKKKRPAELDIDVAGMLEQPISEEQKQVRQLHDRIQTLPPVDKAIVLLWLEGLPYDEIAAMVGISVRNMAVKLHRIKQRLISSSPESVKE